MIEVLFTLVTAVDDGGTFDTKAFFGDLIECGRGAAFNVLRITSIQTDDENLARHLGSPSPACKLRVTVTAPRSHRHIHSRSRGRYLRPSKLMEHRSDFLYDHF